MKFTASVLASAFLFVGAPAMAGEKLSKDEVVRLIWGSRYETSTGNRGLIAADGTLSASNLRSSSEGTWKVTDDGDYCNEWQNPKWRGSCVPFEKTDEPNVYLHSTPEGSARYTFTKKE